MRTVKKTPETPSISLLVTKEEKAEILENRKVAKMTEMERVEYRLKKLGISSGGRKQVIKTLNKTFKEQI